MIRLLKTVAEYDSFIQQNPVAVVHFGFLWNAFDRTMQRGLLELKPEFGEKVEFGFVDADKNATIELLIRVNLVNSPTLIGFKNSEQRFVLIGMRPQDEVRQNIEALFN